MISPNEITPWHRRIANRLPRWLHRLILRFEALIEDRVSDFARSLPVGTRVLDAGAGECRYARDFSHCRYVAVDLAVGDSDWDYSRLDGVADLARLPFRDGSFGAAINIVVLEHVPEPRAVLAELSRVLAPGARLLLAAPPGMGCPPSSPRLLPLYPARPAMAAGAVRICRYRHRSRGWIFHAFGTAPAGFDTLLPGRMAVAAVPVGRRPGRSHGNPPAHARLPGPNAKYDTGLCLHGQKAGVGSHTNGDESMSRKKRTAINPPGVLPPGGEYSYAVSAGGFLFIAGQTAFSPEGELVGVGDAAAQTRQVFKNIGRILEGAGASFNDVVEFTTYLVGVESVGPFLEARRELFPTLYPDGDYPTNTLLNIEVPGRLQGPGGDQGGGGSSRIGLTRARISHQTAMRMVKNILFTGVYATFPKVDRGPAERRQERRVSRADLGRAPFQAPDSPNSRSRERTRGA